MTTGWWTKRKMDARSENVGIGKLRNDGAADGVENYVVNFSSSGCLDVDMC